MLDTPPPQAHTTELFGFDAFSPKDIALRVKTVGVAKARIPLLSQAMLGVLAGAFIGLGALCANMVFSDATLGFAASRFLGGLTFSLGLVLVLVARAELFTGNNLLAMAWVTGQLSTSSVVRNWLIVAATNLAGRPDPSICSAAAHRLADYARSDDDLRLARRPAHDSIIV